MTPDSAEWRKAVGYRNEHHWTSEYNQSREGYVKLLWEQIAVAGEDLTRPQVRARLAALHQIVSDLEELVARACVDEIVGPDKTVSGSGEWSFPVGASFTVHPLGELRQPRYGCDDWKLHHRAYFGAPESWPGALVWALLAFKADSSIDAQWRDTQNSSIAAADQSVTDYIDMHENGISGVLQDVPPP